MTGGEKRQQFMSQITHATGVVYNQLGRLKLLDGKFASMETSFLEQIAAVSRQAIIPSKDPCN